MRASLTRRDFLRHGALAAAAAGLARAASAEPPFRTIDAHVHVWTHDPGFPWAAGVEPPATDAPAEALLRLMDEAGVAQTVLVQVKYYLWDNRYVRDVLRRYPQRFRAIARVNPTDPAALDHLSALTADGFRGVRLSPSATAEGDWIRGPLMLPLWRRCHDLGVPMTVLAPASRMPDVARLADQFPDLTIVVDHMADAALNDRNGLEAVLALRRFPKVHVKISHTWSLSAASYPYRDTWPQVRRFYDAFGPHRLIAGSDWPLVERYCTYAQAIEIARSRIDFLNDADRRLICGENARRIWQFA
jgi:L-fuconolactonase